MALLWINMWIGHVTQTKHHDTRLEYRTSESKNVKWVERKGLACKEDRRTPEEFVVAHITTNRPIREEAKCYNKQRMQHLLLRQKNRHDHVKHVCMIWQLWCNATYHKIKWDRNSDIHMYGSSFFSTAQIKCWLAWQNKAWVSYTILNEVGKPYLVNLNYSKCYSLDEIQITTSLHDARCNQLKGWHNQVLCIFLINFHIKYFVFRVTVWNIQI
jgi:hypothetical protein